MMNYYQIFNLKFQEFLEDLIATYPEETDLQAMANMLKWTISFMGEKVPQEMFDTCVAIPYSEKIKAKNESFFLEECVYDTRFADINIINKLKGKWKNLNEENKEVVWKYMLVLIVLNERCGGHQQ